MAIFRTGPIVGGISGKLGGAVFVQGRGSAVLRPRPQSRFTESDIVTRRRSQMQIARRKWSTLTDQQRDSWRTSASLQPSINRLGQAKPLSGFQLFIQSNLAPMFDAASFREVPWLDGPSPAIASVAATFSISGVYRLDGSGDASPAQTTFLIKGYPYYRSTPTNAPPRLVHLRNTNGTSLFFDIKSDWEALWGPLRVGQYFAVAVARKFADGGVSPYVIQKGFAVA